ncbi:MFS general substrate transporter, partial [Bimuria novae-zelandiae CBS 107.79]
MSTRFSRLPSDDADGGRYYQNRESLDLTESVSYDDYRRKSVSESVASLIDRGDSNVNATGEKENNAAPLRQSLKQYSTLVWWLLAISLPILYSGFDSGVLGGLNSVKAYQRDFGDCCTPNEISKEDESIVPAFLLSIWDGMGPLGQVAGGALGAWFLDRWGRKFSLKIGSLIGIGAILIFVMANTPPNKNIKRGLILAGKLLQGFGLGILKIEAYTYMSEVTPVSLKGAVMSIVPMFTLLGQLVGACAIQAISTSDKSSAYVYAVGSQWILAIPPFIVAFFLPESPAFLLKTKRDTQGALKSFERLLGPKNNARAAMLKMQETLKEEEKKSANLSYKDCFNAANYRRTLIIMFAGTVESLFGLPLISSASLFLQRVGMDHSKSTLFLIGGIVVGIISNTGSTWTVTHIGRRKLTISTLLITSGLWAVVGFAGIKKSTITPWLTGGIFIAIVVICGLGCWPASYAIMGETSSIRLRSRSQALGNLSKNVVEIIMNTALPYFYNPDALNLGGKTGFLYTALAGLGALLAYFFVPELRNRSAIEIDHLFAKGVRSIGSTNWRDTEVEEIPLDEA